MDEILEILCYVVGGWILLFLLFFIPCCLMNPCFWQGYRNSKFIDELKNTDPTDLIEP